MFKKQEVQGYDKVETILGENFHIEGIVKASGSVRIQGRLKGEIEVDGNLVISESAVIEGSVRASNVHMSGKVIGDLYADGQLKLTSSAKMLGDIKVDRFITDEGACFEGNCTMTSRKELVEDQG
ncbi:MAG TPA: cell shape determination protein CcmA [Clostridiales bacterium]|nr:cell shape determination protein CcmA [Clostridiales bacterium]